MPFLNPQFYLEYFLKRERTQLYTSVAIRNFAMAMILIFEPIYLFLYFNQSLTKTFLFFSAIYFFYGILSPFGAKIMAKVGLKRAIFLSIPFLFSYYLALYALKRDYFMLGGAILLIAASLKVVSMLFYWPAFHTDFVRFSEKKNRATQVSHLHIVNLAGWSVSPLLGGFILERFGYSVLFIIVLIVLGLSAFPLLFSRVVHEVYTDSYQRAFKRVLWPENKNNNIAFFAMGGENAISFWVWPVFLFVMTLKYQTIGLISTFSLIIGIFSTLIIGKLADRVGKRRLLRIGSIFRSGAWIIKSFVKTGMQAFLARSFYRISQKTAGVPFSAILYDKAAQKGADADEFIIYREIVTNLAKAITLLFLIFLFSLRLPIYSAFLLASFYSLLLMFL